METALPTGIAALDLGSNSFHMLIANLVNGEPVVVDRIREQVQLAAGLRDGRELGDDAQERAIGCLERFGQRLRHHRALRVRAVGTNTLRVARNARDFLASAEKALGHPIEIISGREEARLVYLGVAHTLSDDAGTRLVVDIGGGSTECILGERFESFEVNSLFVGCVNTSRRFFEDGAITEKAMGDAVLAVRAELQTLERRFIDIGWTEAVGSSGTIKSVGDIVAAHGWSDQGITPDALAQLRKALIASRHVDKLDLPGLKAERTPVFPGGVAILSAVFDALDIERMLVSDGALREGVMYDLLGRIRHEDVRERTIRIFQERYDVDLGQAARVERTALACLRQVAKGWKLDVLETARFLAWAARLHEIGLAVSYTHHHRHSGYLVSSSDMPGFSRDDQRLLAAILTAHRRKPSQTALESLHRKGRRQLALRLTALLRMAVLLNRSRSPQRPPPLTLRASKDTLDIGVPKGWLDEHPLTQLDLEEEAKLLKAVGLTVKVEATEG